MTGANQPSESRPALRWPAFIVRRSITSDIVQGIVLGGVLAYITFSIIANAYVTKIDGWTTMLVCGESGTPTLLRGACAKAFPGPINAPQEAVYWTAKVDGSDHTLSGELRYIMHFPAGQLPPNHGFWSLTMADAQNRFVGNAISRYNVSDRSGLVSNGDGSIDIYIQKDAPTGHESNWLPAPPGAFILWLRVYIPDASIVDGKYKVPPVGEVQ